jgi:hypothetical protein
MVRKCWAGSNPNHQKANPMVKATQAYHKVLRTIDALMRVYAVQEVKDQIRGRNRKVTDYDPREIGIMARELLYSKPDHFVERAKASAVVKEVEAKLAAQAARKAQRRSGHTRPQAVRFPNDCAIKHRGQKRRYATSAPS